MKIDRRRAVRLAPLSVALAIAGASLLLPQAALADCAPIPAADDATVLCTGTNISGINVSNFDRITIDILDGTSVIRTGLSAVTAAGSDDSSINLYGNSTVRVGFANNIVGLGISGDRANITLNDNATVTGSGINSFGIEIIGDSGAITLNDNARVDSALGTIAIGYIGDFGTVTLNDNAAVQSGTAASGIYMDGTGNVVTVNRNASISGAASVVFSSGANTLVNHGTINSNVAAVTGIGASVDTIFNDGTISSNNGLAFDLRAGNDDLTLGTGSKITGDIDGGADTDTVTLTGRGAEDDLFLNFENLVMDGEDWSLSGASSFVDIDVDAGRLAINGAIAATGTTTVAAGGILGGNGTLTTPTVASSGTIAPGNSVGTLNIAGAMNQTGGAFDVEFDKSGIDRTNVTGAVTLAGSPTVNIIPLNGAGGATGIFLHSDTSITGAIGAMSYQGNGAATLIQSANDLNLIAIDGTNLVASNFAALQTGLDYLDTVRGTQFDQRSTCTDGTCAISANTKRLWGQAFGRFGAEDPQDGNMGYNYRNAGTAFGGDIAISDGIRIGGSLGYANTNAEVAHNAAEADIDGAFAALYLTYETGGFFVTGIVSGGLQQFDLERKVANADGTDTARADTDGFLVGGAVQAGYNFDFPGAWRLTPSAGLAYQRQSVDGYSERGAGSGNVDVDGQDSDAFRVNAEFNVARTVSYENFALIPHMSLGVAGQFTDGDNVGGAFSNGTDFTLAQQDSDRLIGLVGAGMDIAFADGVTANIDYDGQLSSDGDQHAIMAGVKMEW